jgi:hypothetical protein
MAKLEAARDALSHSHPGADAETILEAGLDLVIERAAKRKGIVARPRRGPRPLSLTEGEGQGEGEPCAPPHPTLSPGGGEGNDSRAIPAHVKREVWVRDGGCCQWPLDGGGICGSTHRLQFDHVVPRARGGKSTFAGIRMLCQVHNLLAARQHFGDAWMDRYA